MPILINPTAPPEIYTLSLHDALPIWPLNGVLSSALSGLSVSITGPQPIRNASSFSTACSLASCLTASMRRSEEHTSELQSRRDLVCRLLLEKKNTSPSPQTYRSSTPE